MPELPEVEIYRQFIIRRTPLVPLSEIKIHLPKIVKSENTEPIIRLLKGKNLGKILRYGKFLFLYPADSSTDHAEYFDYQNSVELAKQNLKPILTNTEKDFSNSLIDLPAILIHFGMSGDLVFDEKSAGDTHPKYRAVSLHFQDGSVLHYTNIRTLGRVEYIESPPEFIRSKHFGPDAFNLSAEIFLKRIRRRSKPIKSVLLDQKVIAGIGNLYADDALYRTGLHPGARISNIPDEILIVLHANLQQVLIDAIYHGATYGSFSSASFLSFRSRGALCTICQNVLSCEQIGGRTAIFCAFCQKIP